MSTRTYNAWCLMKQRCNNPRAPNYKWYGALDIRYELRWENFKEFFEDMRECPKGMTLDRIDNNKGYSRENCRWTTLRDNIRGRSTTVLSLEQAREIRRLYKLERRRYGLKASLARRFNCSQQTIADILEGKRWQE